MTRSIYIYIHLYKILNTLHFQNTGILLICEVHTFMKRKSVWWNKCWIINTKTVQLTQVEHSQETTGQTTFFFYSSLFFEPRISYAQHIGLLDCSLETSNILHSSKTICFFHRIWDSLEAWYLKVEHWHTYWAST